MPDTASSFSHAEVVLELPALLEVVAGYAASEPGRERLLRLRPRSAEAARAGHPLLADLAARLATGAEPPPTAFPDLRPLLRRAMPEGAVLEGGELLPVRRFLAAVALATSVTESGDGQAGERTGRHPAAPSPGHPADASHAPPYPALSALLAGLEPLAGVRSSLDRALDDEGVLLDEASPRLAELRRELRTAEQQLHRQLEGILKRAAADHLLQDSFVTERNGRQVLPVKRDCKGRFPGVVHDHSDSGHTLFVEPLALIALGNDLADLRLEERDECRRILAALTAAVRDTEQELRIDHHILTNLDAAVATACWADDYGCTLPRFGNALRLRQARHPLLAKRFRQDGTPGALVPLDLELDAETRVLLVSGPNSGGKTAALKTAGLLTIAALAGLPVPASPDSEWLAVEQVLADIGDEQSLAENLSTFTGHLKRIGGILAHTAPRPTLVLLDELGSGTDPVEGGALACAVLATLAESGATVLATTHLGTLKSFVHEHRQMRNASVRFNPRTLQPEFALETGQPGASHALDIAARAGFPAAVLERAKTLLSGDHLRLEHMLADVEEAQRQVARREQELQAAAGGILSEREQVREELARLRHERKRLLHEAYQQAAGIVEHTRRDMELLLKQARAVPAESADQSAGAERSPDGRVTGEELREQVRERRRRMGEALTAVAPQPEHPLPPGELKAGTIVWVEKLRANARIVSVAADRRSVEVEVGSLRCRVPVREVGRREKEADSAKVLRRPPPARTEERNGGRSEERADGISGGVRNVGGELVLIGLRVDEAVPRLEQYLDRAALCRLPEVRIVHGFGTGRLQEAVRECLQRHPLVYAFRNGRSGEGGDPGGAGVTIAMLGEPPRK